MASCSHFDTPSFMSIIHIAVRRIKPFRACFSVILNLYLALTCEPADGGVQLIRDEAARLTQFVERHAAATLKRMPNRSGIHSDVILCHNMLYLNYSF